MAAILKRAVTSAATRNLAAYEQLLERRPLLANGVSAGALGLFADVVCQRFLEGSPELDCSRSWALTSFCTWYHGICCYYIYNSYDRLLPRAALATRLGAGVSKALVDNVLHMPFLYTPAFYAYVGVAQSEGLAASLENLRREWWGTTKSCWLFWGPFDVVMFGLVPAQWRIVVMSCGCLVWNVYLSSCAQAVAGLPV